MKKLKLHPISIKQLSNGHPWVTRDSFSEKFPKEEKILDLYDSQKNKFLGQFIHDPDHPKVVARFWSSQQNRKFKEQLQRRIKNACKKRSEMSLERDNYYLSFGEVDELPGLFIQKLGDTVLIQYQCFFWSDFLKEVWKYLNEYFENDQNIQYLTQPRIPGKEKKAPQHYKGEQKSEITISENGMKFNLKLDLNHDIGIYTDMAGIRQSLIPLFEEADSVLNLFSYTGAFSIMGLKRNAKVTSVDLSKTYMNWLEENIDLNRLPIENHQSLLKPCHKALEEVSEGQFNLIICDPPSFSSNKKKRKSSKDFYRENFTALLKALSPGGKAIIFLNTHQISRKQFRNFIRETLKDHSQAKLIKELAVGQDCKSLPNFPEGDYLKGFVLEKTI